MYPVSYHEESRCKLKSNGVRGILAGRRNQQRTRLPPPSLSDLYSVKSRGVIRREDAIALEDQAIDVRILTEIVDNVASKEDLAVDIGEQFPSEEMMGVHLDLDLHQGSVAMFTI